jgi:taurine dioxygenase
MRTKPLSDVIGVELLDFDVTVPLSPAEAAELRRLFVEHQIVLVRGQNPSLADHDRFTGNFGPLAEMLANGDTGYVSNKVPGGAAVKGGGPVAVTGTKELLWHADGTYGEHPGIATSLMAVEVEPGATPTQFASGVRALEILPVKTRARLEGLRAVHLRDTVASDTGKPWRDIYMPKDAEPGRIRTYEHPLIYKGPHTHKETLFVNYLMLSHISNLPREEGDALLDELYAHIYADENVYTHHWQQGDMLIWDNICLQHRRPDEMGTAARHLRRLVLDGWYAEDGSVIDWFVTSSPRDLALHGRTQEAARYGADNY